MRPVLDSKGRVWMGEMGSNKLAVFDPQTETFQQQTPPRAQGGIMGLVVAHDDTIWFAEQSANYIGHYLPDRQQFQTYDLPDVTTPDPSDTHNTLSLPSAPNDLALDAQGNVWFTEMNADTIGMLDSKSDQFKHYPLAPTKSVQKISPYGITIDAANTVWFSEATSNKLGHLNPHTGDVHFYTNPASDNALMELANDAHGTIWATTFSQSTLVSFNPHTEAFTTYTPNSSTAGGSYGLSITSDNSIWITLTQNNQLAHFNMKTSRFAAYYTIPTSASLPLGVVVDTPRQTVWFTESGADMLGKLKI